VSEVERLALVRQIMASENRALLRAGGQRAVLRKIPEDFGYDFVAPGSGDSFEFGINNKACGFCNLAGGHGEEIMPHICGLDFEAYATQVIRLEQTQTLATGASHCKFRCSRLEPE
jgi:hypothetical protein